MDVANCIHYDHVIFQYEIFYCVGSAKKINWSNFGRKKIGTFMLPDLVFIIFAKDIIQSISK
jgi:hypothetical protein